MKLSKTQKEAIEIMRKYPKETIMHNGYLTGGHGVKINKNTINSLEKLGMIEGDKLSVFGKIVSWINY